MIIFEIISIALIIFTLGIVYPLIRTYKNSNIGNFLVYSFVCVVFLGIIRLFLGAVVLGIIQIDEFTVMLCWHLMLYITTMLFLVAARALVTVLDINHPPKSSLKPLYLSAVMGLCMGLIFFYAPAIELNILPIVKGTWIDTLGIAHFIAFVFAGTVAYCLLMIGKKFSGSIGQISTPLMFSLAIFSLIHFFELLTESWHLLDMPGEVVEMIESVLWIPAMFFIALGYWRLEKALSKA